MYEKITDLENEIEAELLKKILETEGIPFVIKSYHDSAYDGLFQVQLGWGALQAPAEFKEQILAIYRDLKKKPE